MAGNARVIIIGGGIAGLSAAKELKQAGIEALVLERRVVLGGRMSTREFGGAVFDDGAQFFTVKDQRFGPLVEEMIEAGVITDWFHSQLIRGGSSNPDGFPRYCGAKGMRSILDYMHRQGLSVQVNADVTGFEPRQKSYTVTLKDGQELTADAILLAHPVPDAVRMLHNAGLKLTPNDAAALENVIYTPCIAVMATLEKPSALTEWGGLRINGEYVDWIADNHRKGISETPSVTIQAMPDFSTDHWYDDDDDVAEMLIGSTMPLIRSEPVEARVVRYELGKPISTHPKEWVAAEKHPRVLLAGDGFKGYRVEGAAVSGMEAAKELIRQFS
ncbi:FAD-dependent oxidoreductase [bacterium]|nr:FAD-dependent oxidoreductase [bacterium]